ncbi:MAG: hypothetical protein M3Z20_00315 [Chloroflexota bacterium]|nr:hypothetical protein [Chloroflexota bacterium]
MLGKLWPHRRASAAELQNPQDVILVVTDVFWMDDGQVGVAGVLKDGTPVRLRVGDFGPDGTWLDAAGGDPVMPFSMLRLHLGDAPPDISPPFTEERQAAATGHRTLQMLELTDIAGFLEGTCAASVREIFGAQIHVDPGGGKDWYVAAGEGERSLGTVRPVEVQSVTVRRNRDAGVMDFRLSFRDASGESYKLTIGDLMAQSMFTLLGDAGYTAHEVGRLVRDRLRGEEPLYLRIALSRPTEAHPDRCSLQVAGLISLQDLETPPASGGQMAGRASRRVQRGRRP